MKIFVAGASGAIGRRAVPALLRRGHDVTALVHSSESAATLEAMGARLARGNLFDPAAMRHSVAGHDVVINLATRIPIGSAAIRAKAWREDDLIRTEGSKVLARAAMDAGVARFIQESVSFVYPDSGETWITEAATTPTPNPRSQRPTTEAATNAILFAGHQGVGVVLRFGQLYGPDRASAEILRRTRARKPVVLGKPDGWLTPLHPDDAALAVAAALACGSGVYNVGESPVRRSAWAYAIQRASGDPSGRSARFYPALLQRLAGPRAEPLTRSHRVSCAAFHDATGWRARYDATGGGWSSVPALQVHGSRDIRELGMTA
ncbi:MAG TPA: NAD(P)-dependent oxidoreductase [Frankiaceae bacterium]|jgi:nucleoside-diphosphate-sugar epimerase|nr:NAD(P)-dependent oxidoreductase [Frankiaceae bacterium]